MLSAVTTGSAPKASGAVFPGDPGRTVSVRVGTGAHRSGVRRARAREHRRSDAARASKYRGNFVGGRRVLPAGRANDCVSGRSLRLRRHERGLRDVLHAAATRAIDHPGRALAPRRPHRSRRDRVSGLNSISQRKDAKTPSSFRKNALRLCAFALGREDQVRAAERSTSSTPSTPLSSLITFSRCFTSLISTAMLMRPR